MQSAGQKQFWFLQLIRSMRLHQATKFFITKTIRPHALSRDDARREFILNILLVGLITLAGIAFSINVLRPILYPHGSEGQNPLVTGTVLLFLILLWKLSRIGKSKMAAIIFILFLQTMGLYMSYYWGPDLPAVLLFYSLLIVMAGILISASFAFLIAFICAAITITFSYLDIYQLINPHDYWKSEPIMITDSIVYGLIFGIISLVSWISNREMSNALRRARASEATVRRQRDNLEIIVEESTRELQFMQAEKITQLYRFVELGRMSTGLFHDLSNPLTLVSLNLDKIRRQNKKGQNIDFSETKIHLQRALSGTRRLEQFILAARRQVQNKDIEKKFSLFEEITSALLILEYKAKKSKIVIDFNSTKDTRYVGNSVKFNQLVTNIVSNAIDACEGVSKSDKRIEVRLGRLKKDVVLEIQDWGQGIHKKTLPHIFDALFTTKSQEKGMGIGLSISRETVEKYLHGTISVESVYGKGTTFRIIFPVKKHLKS